MELKNKSPCEDCLEYWGYYRKYEDGKIETGGCKNHCEKWKLFVGWLGE
jgi:hypothetical protein